MLKQFKFEKGIYYYKDTPVTKENLYNYYIIEDHNIEETSTYFQIPIDQINRALKLYSIKKINKNKKPKLNSNLTREEYYKNRAIKIKESILKKYGSQENYNAFLKEKQKETNLKRYGVENYSKTKDYLEKRKKTCLERYGNESYNRSNAFKESLPLRIEKTKKTCLEKYGVDSYNKLPEYIERKKKTCLEKYGDENYQNREQIVKTNLERYGVANYCCTKDCKEKQLQYREEHQEEIYNKMYSTMIKRYGAKVYMMTDKGKEERKLITNQMVEKREATMRKNNSFNKSKIEEYLYSQLILIFGENSVVRQYKEKRYPFNCDFYIPSKDLFIELNNHYTHGPHPFDPNNEEDIKELEIIKSKQGLTSKGNKNSYYMCEEVWVKKDVEKQNIAKENNLNYKTLYSDSDIESFLKEISLNA